MSKFVETEYGSTKEILKFPDHYVALAVMVSDAGVTALNGKKIVPKGTIVGGATASVLENLDQAVAGKYNPIATATLITGSVADDNAILWTAVTAGAAGNAVSITIVDPNDISKDLSVAVSNKDITVNLATDADKAITSTAADVAEAVNADTSAKALVVADASINPDGEAAVAAVTKTSLAGGAAAAVTGAEGVLMNDVDVTYGPKEGAMIIHGFVKIDALPYGTANAAIPGLIAADAAAAKAFSAIKFIK